MIRSSIFRSKISKLFLQGQDAFQLDKYEEAARIFSTVIDKIPPIWQNEFPEYVDSVLYMSSLQRIVGKPLEAEKYLDLAFHLIPDESQQAIIWHMYAGDIYTDLGRYKEAEEKYLVVYKFFTDAGMNNHDMFKTLCHNMHTLYIQMGQFELAQEYLGKS